MDNYDHHIQQRDDGFSFHRNDKQISPSRRRTKMENNWPRSRISKKSGPRSVANCLQQIRDSDGAGITNDHDELRSLSTLSDNQSSKIQRLSSPSPASKRPPDLLEQKSNSTQNQRSRLEHLFNAPPIFRPKKADSRPKRTNTTSATSNLWGSKADSNFSLKKFLINPDPSKQTISSNSHLQKPPLKERKISPKLDNIIASTSPSSHLSTQSIDNEKPAFWRKNDVEHKFASDYPNDSSSKAILFPKIESINQINDNLHDHEIDSLTQFQLTVDKASEREMPQPSQPPNEVGQEKTPFMTFEKNQYSFSKTKSSNKRRSISTDSHSSSPKHHTHSDKILTKILTSIKDTNPVQRLPDQNIIGVESSRIRFSGEKIEGSTQISPSSLLHSERRDFCDETPKSKTNALTVPTPRVTGAYVETPLSTIHPIKNDKTSSTINFISQEGSKKEWGNKTTEPNITDTTNKVTVSKQMKCIKKDAGIEDDTDFDQLFEGMGNSVASFNMRSHQSFYGCGDESFDIFMDKLNQMDQNLKTTASKFDNVDQSLERLRKPIYNSPVRKTSVVSKGNATYDNKFTKKKPSFFVTLILSRPEEPIRIFRNRNWKFTWLGLIIFVFGIWSIAEMAMCSAFCHPKYSSKNTWHPSDPFFPWAIPTKFDQWTGQIGSGTIEQVLDWIDPNRHKKWRRPKHLYSGYDWWGGKNGPVSMFIPKTAHGEAKSIDDDEIWA